MINSIANKLHQETVKDVMKELSHVRKVVYREIKGLKMLDSNDDDPNLIRLAKKKRLLYLFMKDLSVGISGEALSNKNNRDISMKAQVIIEGVSWKMKFFGWICVVLLNSGLLFYVCLFAMNQTYSRQSAWFRSFVMWFIFDLFFTSTGTVVLTHLFLPLYVLADVSKIKIKILKDLMTFRERYLKVQDEEMGEGIQTVEIHQNIFNAAKYLYPSWRVAFLSQEIPESGMILQYNTLWPMKRFGEKGAKVASEYDQTVLLGSLSQIFLFFFGSLFHFHSLIQDIFIEVICTSGFGLLGVCFIRLFAVHPILPVTVSVLLMLGLSFLIRQFSIRNNTLNESLTSIQVISPPTACNQEQINGLTTFPSQLLNPNNSDENSIIDENSPVPSESDGDQSDKQNESDEKSQESDYSSSESDDDIMIVEIREVSDSKTKER
jgi:hypothetical protein